MVRDGYKTGLPGVVKSYSCVVSWAGLYGVISFSHGVTKDIHSEKAAQEGQHHTVFKI